jgi:hypothetical protein
MIWMLSAGSQQGSTPLLRALHHLGIAAKIRMIQPYQPPEQHHELGRSIRNCPASTQFGVECASIRNKTQFHSL